MKLRYILFAFVLIAITITKSCNCGDTKSTSVVDINDTNAITNYLQGKWSWERITTNPNETNKYRIEITGTTMKIWMDIGNSKDPFDMSEPPVSHQFTFSSPTRDVDGFRCRYLNFDEGNVSLVYRGVSPFWFISDSEA
jgi:hypothetical protein